MLNKNTKRVCVCETHTCYYLAPSLSITILNENACANTWCPCVNPSFYLAPSLSITILNENACANTWCPCVYGRGPALLTYSTLRHMPAIPIQSPTYDMTITSTRSLVHLITPPPPTNLPTHPLAA
jgi:hypothetical protein